MDPRTPLLAPCDAPVGDVVWKDATEYSDPEGQAQWKEEELRCCAPSCAASGLPWRVFHALCFMIGGTTFIAGTLLLMFPYPGADSLSALLYTVGSCGFLAVDGQELCTFKGTVLLANIFMSFVGSALYVVGSVGFFPSIAAAYPAMGVWGFIIGSAFIGVSQLWKTHRIASVPGLRRLLVEDAEAFTAAGVELSAGLGAWCFFFGTSLYQQGPLEGPGSVLALVLQIWVLGSLLFTSGGLFLTWRHFVMSVV